MYYAPDFDFRDSLIEQNEVLPVVAHPFDNQSRNDQMIVYHDEVVPIVIPAPV